ncbi:NAD(P)/FAD-dependent oxidoreductase [Thermomonas carbonis]|uniref:FAD-dependent oxidoreductase n=1 Tax=Thermomonas carbonis TaxID=1463158 RepID=A0A7G9SQE9_9GAMM|nr:FAD-dependent oxidoreductase [Thermomonas carbonis]QNN70074.1 FAD-dependent oxidoreductase [Thermomonas carbonis]GHB97555.1 dehydrogenase [Thermomonas carbonis]
MRIAIVGSGISGLSAAWLLSRRHEVVLFETNDYLGGHTDTHRVEVDGRTLDVDTGFIVHNPGNYPLLTRLFDELGVATQATTMGFSVQDARSGLEYNATSLDGLFCQRRNLVSPRFWGMLRDLRRFYREAQALLDDAGPGPSLGEYLDANGYGAAFRDQHLVPMASALWSSPEQSVLAFPAKYLVQFMANHHMLQLAARPQWRVVRGGSQRYVEAMASRWDVQVRLSSPVRGIVRDAQGASVRCDTGSERFDQVVLACHSDQALALLEDASDTEREILGAIRYQANDTVLHTDARLLPRNRKAWAAWNAHLPADPTQACTVSYCMNLLQGLPGDTPLVVTLNRTQDIDPARILQRRQYAHPVHTHAAVAAQARRHEIQGVQRSWFAGAYWGWGFHEDGIRSGVEVAQGLGVAWSDDHARRDMLEAPGLEAAA